MHLIMAGIDHTTADISIREKASLTSERVEEPLTRTKEDRTLNAVILSTCNRTEIYFATENFCTENKAIEVFSSYTDIPTQVFHQYGIVRRDSEAVGYLFELACGLHSLILGEDQIITQVNDAAKKAQQFGASDAYLNTLFRHAVTCAKRAKSEVNIRFISPSIVSAAINMLCNKVNDLTGMHVLVIGNGEMGRLAASLLVAQGCKVKMTLRSYRHGETIIPDKCTSIPYQDRISELAWADVVFSATKSPHFTIKSDMLDEECTLPKYFFDLALPRDIEPSIAEKFSVEINDVDSIGCSKSCYDTNEITKIHNIVASQQQKFIDWQAYRSMGERGINQIPVCSA